MSTLAEFGARVRAARLAKGWTVKDLERACAGGITDQALHNIEAGTLPSLARAVQIAAALEVPLAELVGADAAPKKKRKKKV